jgi:hypothetical protein
MSPVIVTNTNAAPGIDPGNYLVELIRIRLIEINDFENPGQKVMRIELVLRILDHPRWAGAEFSDLCTVSFGSRSKLGQLLAALNGGVPIPPGDIDLEMFVGRRMRATIRRKDTGYNSVIPETAVPVDPADSGMPR